MRVLIAGLGSIGQRHLRNLRELLGNGVEILAHRVRGDRHVITEQMTLSPGEDLEEKYGIRVFTRLDEALREHPDAVLVCNPTSEHAATAIAALEAGCHVLIEKPLSHDYDQVEQIIELADRRRLVAAVGFQLRCHPALQRARQLLESGAIGRPRSVRAEMGEYLPDSHPYEDYRTSYAARADLGGGVILCYSHEFDYLCWLFGAPTRVMTTGGRLGTLEIDVEDTALTLFECNVDGAVVVGQLHQSFLQRPASRTCEIIGDRGTIRLDFRASTIDVDGHDVAHESTTYACQRNQLFRDELQNFLAALAGRPAPLVTAREAATSLRMALASKQSLLTGQPVSLA